MKRGDAVEREDAVFVLHQFGEQVHHFHESSLLLIVHHEVVASLVVLGHLDDVGVFQQEELVSVLLHEHQ